MTIQTIPHVERRSNGAPILIIPMSMQEASAIIDAVALLIRIIDFTQNEDDIDRTHLGWVIGRIANQRDQAIEGNDIQAAVRS